LLAVGDLLIGWRLLVQGGIAQAALDNLANGNGAKKDTAFYQGKVATAAFFARNMLPKLTAQRRVLEALDDDVMRISESAF
jgi:hypothetical protein